MLGHVPPILDRFRRYDTSLVSAARGRLVARKLFNFWGRFGQRIYAQSTMRIREARACCQSPAVGGIGLGTDAAFSDLC